MKKYAAEFIGTFVLVFGGVGSAVLAGDKIGFLGVSLAFGLTLLCMAYAIGSVSGCHINPAVTFGIFLSKKMSASDVLGYVVAQILGGIVAAALLLLILGDKTGGAAASLAGAANGYGEHSPTKYGMLAALVAEIVLTFFLVFTVLGATDSKAPSGFAGIPIGFVLVLVHLVGIPVTNMSVNPARSIATAVFTGGWAMSQLWLFIAAPLIGAALASVLYGVVNAPAKVIDTDQSAVAR